MARRPRHRLFRSMFGSFHWGRPRLTRSQRSRLTLERLEAREVFVAGIGQSLVFVRPELAALTGSAAIGGDVAIDYAMGPIEAAPDRFAGALNISGLALAAPVFTSGSSTTFTTTVAGSFTAAATGSPTFSIGQKTFFESDFTTLPSGWALTGSAALAGGSCVLNPNTASTSGALILPKLGATSPGSFTASFDYTASSVALGIGGTSFNYGVLSTTAGSSTTMVGAAGLAVSLTEASSGTTVSRVDVRWNNTVIGSAPVTFASTATPVQIKLDGANFLTVSYDGIQLLDLNLAGVVNAADRSNWQFALGAANSSVNTSSHAIDNLAIVSNGVLPAGVSLASATGVISGAPTTATGAGTQVFNLVATNGDGATNQLFSLHLAAGTPVFSSAASAPMLPGVASTFNVVASGTAGSATYSVAAQTLLATTLANAATLPAGAYLNGSAQFNSSSLELTQNVASQTGWLQFLGQGAQNPTSFSTSFNYKVGGGTAVGGEGMSLTYGAPGDISKGLRVSFTELVSGSNANLRVELFYNGSSVANASIANPFVGNYNFVPVSMTMSDEGRLQVRVNNVLAFDTGAVANWQTVDKSLWAFGFRGTTGASNTNFHTIKDVVIATNGVLPPGLSLNTATGVISGTLGIGTAVDQYVAITATNAAGTSLQSLKLDVTASNTLPGQRPGSGTSLGGSNALGITGEQFRNLSAFAALTSDGSVKVWGNTTNGGAQTDAPTATGYTAITSNEKAFAALRSDGSIFAWGFSANGATGEPTGTGYEMISATRTAFAAIKNDGSVVAWGDTANGGAFNPASTSSPTGTGYIRIFANGGGFVAQKIDGTIRTWGNTNSIGSGSSPSTVFARVSSNDFQSGVNGYGSFGSISTAGSVSTWGSSVTGGTSGRPVTAGQQDIVSTSRAFAAIDSYGSIKSWGDTAFGGTSWPSDSGFRQIYGNNAAFVAIRQDGSLVSWGSSNNGGSGAPTGTGFVQVFSTLNSFAAIKANGSITVWGSTAEGNTTAAPTGTGYTSIFSTTSAFAAIKADGSVTVWGNSLEGGTSGPTGTGWTAITTTGTAFTALKSDGSVFSWGSTATGGTGAPAGSFLTVQSPTLSAPYFPVAAGAPVSLTVHQTVQSQVFLGIQGDGLTFTITSGTLPVGLTLDAVTGWIHGNPAEPGTFPLTINATGAAGSVTQEFTLKVESSLLPNQRQGSGAVYTIGSGTEVPNSAAFAGLTANGGIYAWGSTATGGSGAPTGTGYTQITSNNNAYAALKFDGSITAWGDSRYGGTGAPTGSGYTKIYSSTQSFAALKADGSITAWGNTATGGTSAPTTTGYTKIYAAQQSFAAMKADGSITVWGDSVNTSVDAPTGTGYTSIVPNVSAYAALKADGSITAWGLSSGGGTGEPTATGYTKIFASNGAYAALKIDGSIAVWGSSNAGGTSGPSGTGFVDIWSSASGFAALKTDGSLVSWGASGTLGTAAPTGTGFTQVFSTGGAFAALKADGSIVSWGATDSGGTGAPTATGYTTIYTNNNVFAAMKADGSITAWGSSSYGGTGAPTATGYTQIFSRKYAFAAMKADGTVSVWGSSSGGVSGASGQVEFASIGNSTAVVPARQFGVTGNLPAGRQNLSLGTQALGVNGVAGFQVGANTGLGLGSAITSGSLPAGITLNVATGFLEGTPTATGTSTFTVTSYNGTGQSSQAYRLTVSATTTTTAAPYFDPAKAIGYANYAVGQSATYDLSAVATPTASANQLSYAMIAGSLPTGMYLQTTGSVIGTPTVPGNYQFTLAASDKNGIAAQTFTIKVSGDTPNQRTGQYSTIDAMSSGGQGLNEAAFAALKADGTIVTWGDSTYGGTGAAGVPTGAGYVQIAQTARAFAALRYDGSIQAWGNTDYGGTNAPTDTGFSRLFSNGYAFAAMKADGSIATWGNGGAGGTGEPTGTGYTQIFTNSQAMVALKTDGSLVAWGSSSTGGSGAPTGTGYVTITANSTAFAALKSDGSITAWGNSVNGGTQPTLDTNNSYTAVYSNSNGFAAVRADGSIATWGATAAGDKPFPGGSNFISVSGTGSAFAALKSDGTIATWGTTTKGGSNGPTGTGYTQIYSTQGAFAGLRTDGSITSWGNTASGSAGTPVGTGYTQVYSNTLAFTAVRNDGTVKSWGSASSGGFGQAPTTSGYAQVFSTPSAFVGQKGDGSLVAWGATASGGAGAPAGTGFSVSSARAMIPYQQSGTTGVLPTAYLGTPIGTEGGAGPAGYQLGAIGQGSSYAVTAGALPGGLTLNQATGFISGTPAGLAGTYSFTIASTSAVGSASQAYTLEVKDRLSVLLPSQQTGAAMINAGSFPNLTAFAALKPDGSITAWGDPASGGTGAPTGTGFTQVFSTSTAFAALKTDGSITAWGNTAGGGTGAPTGTGFTQVFSAGAAFAALTSDGSVVAWGNAAGGGSGAPTGTGFTQVFATGTAFAALHSDGSITAWGDTASGGAGAPTGTGFTQVIATSTAFAGLRTDGTIASWGNTASGGSSAPTSTGFTQVFATSTAFAALKSDGSITAWGETAGGGSGAPTSTGFTQVFSTGSAFAALRSNGQISVWGNTASGGTSSPTSTGFTAVYSTSTAFAALKADGSITAWGNTAGGGTSGPTGTGFTKVFSTGSAFAAMKADGSITAWGSTAHGGTNAPTSAGFTRVFSTDGAFAAMKADGSITVWGSTGSGGSGGPIGTGYTTVQSALVSTPAYATYPDDSALNTRVNQPFFANLGAQGIGARYEITVGSLPSGLTLDGTSGVVSGTATVSGDFAFILSASTPSGTASQSFTLSVQSIVAPSFTSAASATFTAGTAGTFTVTSTGVPAATYAVTVGTLPSGLTLNAATGVLSGTPAAGTGGVTSFTITATNAAGSADQSFTLTVNESPSFTSAASTTFTIGTSGTFTVAATGFPSAVTYAVTAGALPSGLTLNATTGVLSGTPAMGTGGVTNLTITATNAAGSTNQPFTLTVIIPANRKPTFISPNSTSFVQGQSGSFTVVATGYPLPVTYRLATGSNVLPAGLTLNANTGVISGTSTVTTGAYRIMLQATNGAGTTTQNLTITITAPHASAAPPVTGFVAGNGGGFTSYSELPQGRVDVISGGITVTSGLSPVALVARILEGRGDGTWNGTSGITSSAAAADLEKSIQRTVGWLDNGDGSVTASYAAPGDTNLDLTVDVLDAANFIGGGKVDTGMPASWAEGDFGYDSIVDILDAAEFLATGLFDAGMYGTTMTTNTPSASSMSESLTETVSAEAAGTYEFQIQDVLGFTIDTNAVDPKARKRISPAGPAVSP